ncbi:hypothetical protein [uncultured Duncaniella sp.]|uniref:hypothetical protein n=2 Tax=uncultured Duncaniella sp. TaxID=2768039 RepID=UPI002675CCF9|nr:hypothetical protein [uncultured Duncaniella sp.]MCI9172917.1 hypothetical protein [Muribaculaceae bacterium]
MAEYNRMQIIKRRFFAMRNGIIADTLRKAGLDYRMIFGLNLPQVVEIAGEQPHEPALAEELWADRRTRESMLLAPMLYPHAEMDGATARRWLAEAPTVEVADVLCLKLLRNVDGAFDMAVDAMTADRDMTRYTALRLMFNLLTLAQTPAGRDSGLPEAKELALAIRPFAEAERKVECRLTAPVAMQLLDEIEFLTEE